MTNIKIAFASDENFARHLATLIASILSNSNSDETFDFYVLNGGITEESQQKICLLKSIKDFNIQFLKIDFDKLKNCPNLAHFSKNTYSRLFLSELLPEVNRIIYLDSDMIVTGSLSELWKTDLQDKSIGVVLDFNIDFDLLKNQIYALLLGVQESDIFNAGMLLLNLEQIRKNASFSKAMQWIELHQDIMQFADQDALSVIFQNDKMFLNSRWNGSAQIKHHQNNEPIPTVIHFLAECKPWHIEYNELYRDIYEKYLNMTPWSGFLPVPCPSRVQLKNNENKLDKWSLKGIKNRIADFLAMKLLRHSPWLQQLMNRFTNTLNQNEDLKNKLNKLIEVIKNK